MEAILAKLSLPTEGESYHDYKSRMESEHGNSHDACKAIKIKYFDYQVIGD